MNEELQKTLLKIKFFDDCIESAINDTKFNKKDVDITLFLVEFFVEEKQKLWKHAFELDINI